MKRGASNVPYPDSSYTDGVRGEVDEARGKAE
jgi:hypothetical protein